MIDKALPTAKTTPPTSSQLSTPRTDDAQPHIVTWPNPITLAFLREGIAARTRLADADPEAGHGQIDSLCEAAVLACAAGAPDAQEMAREVVALLDLEAEQDWVRWYA